MVFCISLRAVDCTSVVYGTIELDCAVLTQWAGLNSNLVFIHNTTNYILYKDKESPPFLMLFQHKLSIKTVETEDSVQEVCTGMH